MILQYATQSLPSNHQTLYTSLDSLYFTGNTLIGLAEKFASQRDLKVLSVAFGARSALYRFTASPNISKIAYAFEYF